MANEGALKAVILARGLGTRMRRANSSALLDAEQERIADSGLKAMIPVGRPFLDYVLSALADAGYRDICLVIGPEHVELRNYYTRKVTLHRIRLHFAIQEHPLGTANAVAAAEEFVAGDQFLALNSDNYYPVPALRALRELDSPGLVAFERECLIRGGNFSADRVRQYAVLRINEAKELIQIIEKPDEQTLATFQGQVFISMNCWRFSSAIFRACERVRPSVRGELELAEAVMYAIQSLGERFRVVKSRESVLDLSSRLDIPAVAERLKNIAVEL